MESIAKFYFQDNRELALRDVKGETLESLAVMTADRSKVLATIEVVKKDDELEFAGTLYVSACVAEGIYPERMRGFARNCADKECRPFLTSCDWRDLYAVRVSTPKGAHIVNLPKGWADSWVSPYESRMTKTPKEPFWLSIELLNAQAQINGGGYSPLTQEDICELSRIEGCCPFPKIEIV